MAVGTATALISGAGALMGGYQAITGANERRREQRALDNYERQDLDNAFQEMPISTEGIDYMRDENARTTAALVDAARNGGTRSVIGAVPKIVGSSQAVDANIARYLDDQFNRRNYAIAQDNARIEGITEGRDIANINALSTQVNAGRQDFFNGLMGIGSAMGYVGRNMTPAADPYVTPVAVNPITTPVGAPQAPITATQPYMPNSPFFNLPTW